MTGESVGNPGERIRLSVEFTHHDVPGYETTPDLIARRAATMYKHSRIARNAGWDDLASQLYGEAKNFVQICRGHLTPAELEELRTELELGGYYAIDDGEGWDPFGVGPEIEGPAPGLTPGMPQS